MIQSSLLYRCNDRIGEAATWLPALGLFLWVDIDNGILHQYCPDNETVKDHTFPEMVSAVIPWKDHGLEVILAMKNRFVSYHLANRTYTTLLELPGLHPGLRTNDCKASPEGRLWCGIMHINEHYKTGSLCCVERDLSWNPVLRKQYIPNGMVWSRRGDRMYYADSGRACIEEYAYDRISGTIDFLRTVVRVPQEYGVPDGMTIDANGLLWVAHWGGSGVYIWNPADGCLVDKVEVPVPRVASCTFGGESGNQLFITTALAGLSAADLKAYPLSGSLFVAEVPEGISGENHYPFVTG